MNEFLSKEKEFLRQAQGTVYPYSDRWVESHRAFAEKMWPNKLRRRDEDYNRWKFKGPQYGDVNGLLLAVVNDQVVGQLGLIPAKLWVDGQTYQAQWACDLMVDRNYRKMGLGSMMFAVAMNRGWVTLGSEPSPLADITMSRIGFKPLVGPEKMILPLDISVILGWVMGARLNWLEPLLTKLFQPLVNLRNKILSNGSASQIQKGILKDIIPLVDQYQSLIKKPYILHDNDFLSWRYNVPIRTNIMTLISPKGGYAICEPSNRYYYVYDWFVPDNDNVKNFFIKILQEAIRTGCQNILAYANDFREKKQLKSFGFLKMRTPLKIIYHTVRKDLGLHDSFHYCIYDSDGNL